MQTFVFEFLFLRIIVNMKLWGLFCKIENILDFCLGNLNVFFTPYSTPQLGWYDSPCDTETQGNLDLGLTSVVGLLTKLQYYVSFSVTMMMNMMMM